MYFFTLIITFPVSAQLFLLHTMELEKLLWLHLRLKPFTWLVCVGLQSKQRCHFLISTQTTLKECMLPERPFWVRVFNLQVWNCRLILSPGSLLSSLLIHATVTAIKSNSSHTPSPIKPGPCWGRPHDNESGDNWVISRPQLQNQGEEPLGDATSRLKVPTECVLLPRWALPALVSQLKLLLGDTK